MSHSKTVDRRPGRRAFIAGAAVVAAGAVGVAAGTRAHVTHHPPPAAPPEILAALARERALIAGLDAQASTAMHAAVRADHRAHADALRALLVGYAPTSSAPSTSSALPSAPGTTTLAQSEADAARAGATAALVATGGLAALLASISACEASHVVLLT